MRTRTAIVRRSSSQSGIALPLALFLLVFIAGVTGMFASVSIGQLATIKTIEASNDTFFASEGTAHDLLRQMGSQPELWRERVVLSPNPAGYTEYAPSSFSSTNGIPTTCSGSGCQRHMYPIGGGVVKNFGPYSTSGRVISTSKTVIAQYDTDPQPTDDITLNGLKGWVQVERLDERNPDTGAIGGSLENNGGGINASVVRFRVNAVSERRLKGRTGRTTVVYVVELPST